jgi:endonuclease YncB( thermonuclease family)
VMRTSLMLIALFLPVLALGHGGGLDSYGCHHNRKVGGYHCHRGENAGEHYASKQEMLGHVSNGQLETKLAYKEKPRKSKADSSGSVLTGKVVGIADGDTLTMLVDNVQYKIRLAEIDTPEKRQPYGTRAKQALSEMVFGEEIRVEVQTVDRYGRTVARVYIDDVDVCAELVRQGMAWVYRRYVKDESLYDVEQEAKNTKRGIWSLPVSQQIPPWEWRRNR